MGKTNVILIFVSVIAVSFLLVKVQTSYADHLCQKVCEPDGFGGTECWLECSGTPVASDVSVTIPNYCATGPSATVSWDYSDPKGSPQSAYQIQINYQSSPGSPSLDSGKVVCSGCRSYFGGQGVLGFNTIYRARVRVWNSFDIPSAWGKATLCTGDGCSGESWRTPLHSYPDTNSSYKFTWLPAKPQANELVQFTDRTLFASSSSNKQWSWTFVPQGRGYGSSTRQNPTYAFGDSSNIYQITEAVRDNAMPPGQYCAGPTQTINILRPAPIWKEITPR